MSRDYITHWIIGVLCALIWFWGDRIGIPPNAVALAASVVPAALADAMRKSSDEFVAPEFTNTAVSESEGLDPEALKTQPVQIGVNIK